ncbi:MAG: tetratricopeptide repeat protein, partial [Rhodanobacter sp.]
MHEANAAETVEQTVTSVRSRASKFKQLRHFTAGASIVLGLSACAAVVPRVPPPAPPQPLARLVVATPDTAHDLLAQLLAGEMALTRTDLTLAAGYYDKAMVLSDNPAVAERAAGLAIAVHDGDIAQRALDRWQALGAKPVDMAQARAELALDRGDTAEAQRQLTRLVGSSDPDAWRRFGRVLLGVRDQAQAATLLEALAVPSRLPNDPKAWLAMSEMGEKFGRHAYALQLATMAAKRFKSAETYAWAARLMYQKGDQAEARAMLQHAMAKAPGNPALRLGYADMLSQAGDNSAAIRLLEQGPQNVGTYAMRAGLAARTNDQKALAVLYRQLQNASEEVRAKNAYLLGQLAQMQHLDEAALDWYGLVGDDDPNVFDADLRSAVILHSQGKSPEAHALLQQLQLDYLEQPAELRQAYQVDAELYM